MTLLPPDAVGNIGLSPGAGKKGVLYNPPTMASTPPPSPPSRGRLASALAAALLALAALLMLSRNGGAEQALTPPPGASEEVLRHNNLGIAYLAQYKPAEAEKEFRQAIALDPNFIAGRVNAGIAALAQVHYDDALKAFGEALALDPDNIHAHFNLSLIQKLLGVADQALAEAKKAMQLDPRDPDIRYHVGSLHLTRREFDDAIRELETVLKLDPNFLSAYYSLGRAWISKGDVAKGKQYMETHKELQAGAGATPAVGLRYGEQGKYSYAMEDQRSDGPTPQLAEGAVALIDVTAGSGLAFRHGAKGSAAQLKRAVPGSGRDSPALLRDTIAPLLGPGVACADVDGDGRDDLFFPNADAEGRAVSELYLNRGGMRFERAPLAGPGGAPLVSGRAIAAVFGDLDADADPDIVVSLTDRLLVLINRERGSFAPAPSDAGLDLPSGPPRVLGGVTLADVDHDGDLDIHAAGFLAAPAPNAEAPKAAGAAGGAFPEAWPGGTSFLLLNATGAPPEGGAAPPVRFSLAPATTGVSRAGRRSAGAVFSDFDNDRDIDFAVASPADGTTVFSNMRDGTFQDLAERSGLPSGARVLGLTAGDYDQDGWMDLAATTWDSGLPRLFRNMMGESGPSATGAFALDVSAMADVPRQIAEPQFGVAFADLDNDGHLDLVAVNGGDVGQALFVFRNNGEGRFADASHLVKANAVAARQGRGLAVSDLDADGDLDLVIANAAGAPTLLRNDGGNRGHWIRVSPTGLHSNKQAVGTKVEIKAGRLWQKQEIASASGYMSQSASAAHFGLGARQRVDTVRLLWPGGVLQDEVQVAADAVLAVQELDRKGSSCPILYAWNGAAMAFVSDFLGGSAIGYRTGPASFNYPDTEEFVAMHAAQLVPKDGALELRLVNQLEETIYYDRATLLAVDHPEDVAVHPDERLMPAPPFPPFRIHATLDTTPVAAVDDRGRDLSDAIARIDRVYAAPPGEQMGARFRGYAPQHHLTLDLGPVPAAAKVVLLLHGWIDYADSTSNLAAAQAGLTLTPPWLEALEEKYEGPDAVILGGTERRGRWVRAIESMGFPAGLPKTMTVDLTGKLPPGTRIVRIGTSMRLYWDRILVATGEGSPPVLTRVVPTSAALRHRGFPAIVLPDGHRPEEYDYANDETPVHWKVHSGAYTRYGDVRELLVDADERDVIPAPGDELALSFPADQLPPLAPGYRRDWLLHTDGFGKDMDINAARPHTVGPLPWHGMTAYPPPKGESYPFERPDLLDYIDRYNTREVRSPLRPLANR